MKTLKFTVQNKEYHISFKKEDLTKKKQKLQSIAYVQDIENVLCNAYRHFAAIESKLLREYAVSQTR